MENDSEKVETPKGGSPGKCTYICSVLIVVIGIWLAWGLYPDRTELHRIVPKEEWSKWERNGIPRCERPLILKNVFSFGDSEAANGCRDLDACIKVAHEALVKVFGQEPIVVYPVSELCTPNPVDGTRHSGARDTTFGEYMDDPKYDRWMIPAMRLGTVEQYKELWDGFKPKNNNFWNSWEWLMDIPNHKYMGTQVFMARGNLTGSHIHWAWGLNILFLLSGTKRWVQVPPEYLYDAGCMFINSGIHGSCFPNGYDGSELADEARIDLDRYVEELVKAGVPREHIADYTITAGDVAIECDVWPHVVMNLSPEATAFTLRYKPDIMYMLHHLEPHTVRIMLHSIWKSVRAMIFEPDVMTFIHVALSDENSLDVDPRMSANSILDGHNSELEMK